MIVEEAPIARIAEVADISPAFLVDRVVDADLREHPVARPYTKDYDAIEGNHPTDWTRDRDLSGWGLLFACQGDERVGAAVIGVRGDTAMLWDLRVAPGLRGRGIGAALFDAAMGWAAARGWGSVEIETQDNNAAACAFYARRGCELVAFVANAYPELPGEARLLFRRRTASA